jgi:hypothetical protein
MNIIQEELELFAAPSFEALCRQKEISGLSITLSRRLRTSWHLKTSPYTRMRQLTVPAKLADAPETVKTALLLWAGLPMRPRKNQTEIRKYKRELERTVWDYLIKQGLLQQRRGRTKLDQASYRTAGTNHDLAEIYQSLNQRYFGGKVDTIIRWGSFASTTSYQTYRTDSEGNRVSLITIAGAYDHAAVPRYAVEGVVYHEMLHVVIPPFRENGRRVVHGAQFKRAEQAFPLFTLWRAWERDHLRECMRSLRARAAGRRKPR